MTMTSTVFLSIESDCGRFCLSDLMKDNETFYKTPYLQLRDSSSEGGKELELWDNDAYLLRLFKSLESDTHTTEFFQLVATCGQYGWNLAEVIDILKEMYETAKELEFFKK